MRRIAELSCLAVTALALSSVPSAAAESTDGALLYRTYCTACHGLEGNGRGINTKDMAVQPRDHTDSREMGARTDDELFRAISGGGPAVGKSVLMPPWGAVLSDDQIWALVAHLRKLSGTAAGGGSASAATRASADPAPGASEPPAAKPPPRLALSGGGDPENPPPPPDSVKARYPGAKTHHFQLRVEERLLSVAPGFQAKVWAFNGQVPGPLLRVREGDEVIVDLSNLSTMEHTIHWHGMHQVGSWRSDGVPNITQRAVPPGGSFRYHFIATRPGTLWYHCHVNVPEHVGLRGMWGPLIVDPREPLPIEQEVTKEALLMFSGWSSEAADRYGVGGHPNEPLDYYSINGKSFPLTQPLRVKEGDVLRLRLFAAASEVAFHLHGHDILVTHKDGLPLPEPFYADVLDIAQGARYDAIVRMDNPGLWIDHDHIEHHVSNAGKAPGGAVMVVEYEDIEKPDWYVWKDKRYQPDFYLSESMARGYGLFEQPAFRGEEIPIGR
ncbi:MAG: multicopper oxidase domain-containing protein [Myxococcota bacterium]